MKNITFIIITIVLLSCNSDDKGSSKVNSVKKEPRLREGRPSYLIFGLPDAKFKQRQVIARKYRFVYQSVGNCEMTDSIRDAIKKHNKITDNELNSMLGEGWKKRFDYSVDSLYSLDSIAIFTVESNTLIKNFIRRTERKNTNPDFYPGLEYKVFPTRNENIFLVSMEGYGAIKRKIVTLNYLRVTLDIKSKSILNIDSMAYKVE